MLDQESFILVWDARSDTNIFAHFYKERQDVSQNFNLDVFFFLNRYCDLPRTLFPKLKEVDDRIHLAAIVTIEPHRVVLLGELVRVSQQVWVAHTLVHCISLK